MSALAVLTREGLTGRAAAKEERRFSSTLDAGKDRLKWNGANIAFDEGCGWEVAPEGGARVRIVVNAENDPAAALDEAEAGAAAAAEEIDHAKCRLPPPVPSRFRFVREKGAGNWRCCGLGSRIAGRSPGSVARTDLGPGGSGSHKSTGLGTLARRAANHH